MKFNNVVRYNLGRAVTGYQPDQVNMKLVAVVLFVAFFLALFFR